MKSLSRTNAADVDDFERRPPANVAEVVGVRRALALNSGTAAYLLLIPPFGILGAAYGSLVGYSVCMVIAIVAAHVAGSRTATLEGVPVP